MPDRKRRGRERAPSVSSRRRRLRSCPETELRRSKRASASRKKEESPRGETEIVDAIARFNLPRIRTLAVYSDVSSPDVYGRTAILTAIRSNEGKEKGEARAVQLINFLLDAKADPNVTGAGSNLTAQFPVIQAAQCRMWKVLELLLERRARVNVFSHGISGGSYSNVLKEAVRSRQLNGVKTVLKYCTASQEEVKKSKGALLHVDASHGPSKPGVTALTFAVYFKDFDIIDLLVRAGARCPLLSGPEIDCFSHCLARINPKFVPWSPVSNRLFPPRFRAAVRTVLLVAHRSSVPKELWFYVFGFLGRKSFGNMKSRYRFSPRQIHSRMYTMDSRDFRDPKKLEGELDPQSQSDEGDDDDDNSDDVLGGVSRKSGEGGDS